MAVLGSQHTYNEQNMIKNWVLGPFIDLGRDLVNYVINPWLGAYFLPKTIVGLDYILIKY